MIYDGDCAFCFRWVQRWRQITGDRVDYLPSQDPRLVTRFPELSRERLDAAVHLITPDGSIYSGAEAVLRSLSMAGRTRCLLRWYERSNLFARSAEWVYRFIARHRKFFSKIS